MAEAPPVSGMPLFERYLVEHLIKFKLEQSVIHQRGVGRSQGLSEGNCVCVSRLLWGENLDDETGIYQDCIGEYKQRV